MRSNKEILGMADRNFDDLAQRFQRKVYEQSKGDIRQAVLQRDYQEYLSLENSSTELSVFDAGGGLGQTACYFAERGHKVLLCDISNNMLELAQKNISERNLNDKISIHHQSIDQISKTHKNQFDIVTCHAVLEWVDSPLELIRDCLRSLKPQGYLSLTYYNVHGLVYKNLLRTNFKRLRKNHLVGDKGSLTPTSPLNPAEVNQWIENLHVDVICESGIRVFHDYIFDADDRARDPEGLEEMELRYSRVLPYKHLGRYIHLLLKKH